MDKFTRRMLEETGLAGMIGKAERGPTAIEAIRDNQAVSMIAVGVRHFGGQSHQEIDLTFVSELGMEAIYEFEVQDMPVTVSVDSKREFRAHRRAKDLVPENCRAHSSHPTVGWLSYLASRKRSASKAAMQPKPALVMAWR
ncbi:MAG: hypothetical protein CM15mP120_02790 [Pseudomonadota bacterium]|nr:MAG: hypothetical protein CM15mP120_02790 [Pseudomonadota bacterium]